MNDNKIQVSDRIYELRKEKGLSQGEFANLLEVSRQSVSKWETSVSKPDIENLVKMSEIFGVSVDSIVNYNYEKEQLNRNPIPQSRPANYRIFGMTLTVIALIVFLIINSVVGVGLLLVAVFFIAYKNGNARWNVWVVFWELYSISIIFGFGTFSSLPISFQILVKNFDNYSLLNFAVLLVSFVLFLIMSVWYYKAENLSKEQKLISITAKYFICNLMYTFRFVSIFWISYSAAIQTAIAMVIQIAFVVLWVVYMRKNTDTRNTQKWFIILGILYLITAIVSFIISCPPELNSFIFISNQWGYIALLAIQIVLLILLIKTLINRINVSNVE